METTETTCARHPGTATRLRCSNCGVAICPRCAVDTVVGQKCPDCAKPAKGARARGRPRQLAKGLGAGAAAAVALSFVLPYVISAPFLSWIGTGFAGYGIGRAVRWGAENNRNQLFVTASIGLALTMVLAGSLLGFGAVIVGGPFGAVLYVAAGYGAWVAFNR